MAVYCNGKKLRLNGWVPAKEEMPEPNEYIGNVEKYYLVQTEYGDMCVAHWDGKYWYQMNYWIHPLKDKIIAWQELPKEYKGEGYVD